MMLLAPMSHGVIGVSHSLKKANWFLRDSEFANDYTESKLDRKAVVFIYKCRFL